MAPRHIAHSDLSRDGWLRVAFVLFRFMLYATLGIALEVALYSVARAGRQIPIVELFFQFDWKVDPRLDLDGPWLTPLKVLFGQSSLWMIPVYALPSLTIEQLFRRGMFRWPWWLRAPIYGLVIMAFELTTGLALKAITGYAIWMVAGLAIERIYRELMDPDLRRALQHELDHPPPPPL